VFCLVEDYPRDLLELEARFSNEAACREYLAQLRWPNGFRCPHCSGGKAWSVRGVLLECAACGAQTSVTAGAIFQDTRTTAAAGIEFYKRDRIISILKETKGRVGGADGAAARLGLKRTTLIERMKKLGIEPRRVL